MGKIILFSLMVVCIFFSKTSFANDHTTFSGQTISGKFYVEPETIHVDTNHIFLEIQGNFVPVEALYVDEYGIYVNCYNLKCGHVAYCPRCGGCHPNNRCQSRCKCPR